MQKIYAFIKALSRRQKHGVLLGIDTLLVPLAMGGMLLILQPGLDLMALTRIVLPTLPYLVLLAGTLSWALGLPQVRLAAYETRAVGQTAKLTLALMAALWGLTLINPQQGDLRGVVVFGLLYFIGSVTLRMVMLQIVNTIYSMGKDHRNVLIYGAGTTGVQLAQALKVHDEIMPVAFVDDNTSLHGVTVAGLPVYSATKIEEVAAAKGIERVLLTMPSLSSPKQMRIARTLEKMGLEVQTLPSFSQLIGAEELIDKLTPVSAQSFLGRDNLGNDLSIGLAGFEDKTVLVSGAGGSIGSELCRQILGMQPSKIILYELSELALYTIHQELEQLAFETNVVLVPVLGSVCHPRQVEDILKAHTPQIILHAAAYKHVPLVESNPIVGLDNNVFGTQVLAKAAIEAGVERFILISSDKAVRPTNIMGASKRLAEQVIQDLATRSGDTLFSMVRFGNVLGSSGSVIPLFQEQVARGGPVTITDPRMTRYFMTVQEAARLVLLASAFSEGGEVFVLDMGEPVSILHLARQVIESAGFTVKDSNTPDGDIEIISIGKRPGEKLYEELTVDRNHAATPHPKIFVARESHPSEIEMAALLQKLRNKLDENDMQDLTGILTNFVEGYVVPSAEVVPPHLSRG